eukprot:106895-Rhodomonas_salina.1
MGVARAVLQAGKRMALGRACPQPIQTLIVKCWDREPAKRPTFKEVWPRALLAPTPAVALVLVQPAALAGSTCPLDSSTLAVLPVHVALASWWLTGTPRVRRLWKCWMRRRRRVACKAVRMAQRAAANAALADCGASAAEGSWARADEN